MYKYTTSTGLSARGQVLTTRAFCLIIREHRSHSLKNILLHYASVELGLTLSQYAPQFLQYAQADYVHTEGAQLKIDIVQY